MKRISLALYLLLIGTTKAEGEAAEEEAVEEAVEEAIEEGVEDAVEEAIEEAVEEAIGGDSGIGMRDALIAQKMEADMKVDAPRFIASVFHTGDCEDADGAVADANTALTSAESTLATLMSEMEPLVEAVATARSAKADAVTAVVDADAALATDLAADDSAQGTLLTLAAALNDATYNEAAAIQAATDALNALTAAQTALDDGTTVQTAMDTAATAALDHYTHEQGQTATLTTDRNTAETTYNDRNGEESALQGLYDTAKGLSDATAATLATKTTEKADANALNTQLQADLVLAIAAINAATDPSVAKTKADEEATLATKQTDLDTTSGNWQTRARSAVKLMADWVAAEVYTEINDGANGCDCTSPDANMCSGAYNGSNGTTNGTGSSSDCENICSALPAWGMSDNLPTGASFAAGGTGGEFAATHCYGISFSTNNTTCTIMQSYPLANGSLGDDWSCKKRMKSVYATSVVNAIANGITSGQTEYDAMIVDLGEWETQQNVVLAAVGAYNMANEYKGLLDTIASDAQTASDTADTAFTDAQSADTPLQTDTSTKLTNLTDKQSEIATALANWNSLIAQVTANEAEEAAQLSIKNLADADKAAQDLAVTALTTARDDASTAKDTADTASTDATTAKTTAQTNYDNQVPTAAATASAIATPLATLGDLRTTAATMTTDLNTALQNVSDQQDTIDAQQVVVDAAVTTRLNAIVACKEENFDEYTATLLTAVQERISDLETIGRLVEAQVDAMPAKGTQGARCEKAISNGTFRPSRDETTCDEGLCCGAARIPQGEVTMIIETCQPEETSQFNWAPPRAGMATAAPASDPYPFTCISGAKTLAAAASALATAVYMLA